LQQILGIFSEVRALETNGKQSLMTRISLFLAACQRGKWAQLFDHLTRFHAVWHECFSSAQELNSWLQVSSLLLLV